ncbi:MAG TPA: lipoyl(octanoyl) transferase LipB [Nannocystaceae bacterium]|nr:lipoyl(octanoyl) transferase LipB [Nannocystaceae bacterium]
MSEGENVGELRAVFLGRMRFAPVLELQLALREAILAGTAPPTILLVEHPAVLTLGRRGRREDVIWTDEQLAAFGVEICETPRGGQVTLHAPGQLVAYPIVRIGFEVRRHVTQMGRAAVELLDGVGVPGCDVRTDKLGVWLGEHKLASMGVHVSRGITVQGIAINLDVDARLFGALVSCGLPAATMDNAKRFGAAAIAMDEAARRYAEAFARARGDSLVHAPRSALVP